ncbi:hypothetical protein [Metabacillus sp. SLBN-84]
MEQIPEINIGDWVVLTEDGLWAMDSYTFQNQEGCHRRSIRSDAGYKNNA